LVLYRERKLNRLRSRDYSKQGWYFVTVCCKNMKCWLGKIENNQMILNDLGKIVYLRVNDIERFYKRIKIIDFVVMPNHVHMLVQIVGTEQCSVRTKKNYGLLSKMIKSLKDVATKEIRRKYRKDFGWHRSFYDEIVRDKKMFLNIKQYIKNNPKLWYRDRNNLGVNNH